MSGQAGGPDDAQQDSAEWPAAGIDGGMDEPCMPG